MDTISAKIARKTEAGHSVTRGTISYDGLEASMPCIVKEITHLGARLGVQTPVNVPNSFNLMIQSDGFKSECEIISRTPNEVCVRFRTIQLKGAPAEAKADNPPVAKKAQPVFGVRTAKGGSKPGSGPGAKTAPPIERLPGKANGAGASPPKVVITSGPILIAEDDPDDRLMIQDAFEQCEGAPPLEFVEDGQELLDYLNGEEKYLGKARPRLVLLDLNMPRVDGRKALVRMKNNPKLRSIPVIILTTSNAEMDIERTYGLGASSFIQKPNSFRELVDMAALLVKFWTAPTASPAGTKQTEDVVLI